MGATLANMRGRAAMVLALLALSCGGSVQAGDDPAADGGANADVSIGEVDGTAFLVRSASADFHDDPTGTSWIGIGLTTQSGTDCGAVRGGGTALEIYIFTRGGPLSPGTYPLSSDAPGQYFGDAILRVYGPSCEDTRPQGPSDVQGTITLTSLEPRVRGNFDLVTQGVHLAGRIDARRCSLDGEPVSVGRLDACK
jgi:hypothetical protein